MAKNRSKNRRVVKRMQIRPAGMFNRDEQDQHVFNSVLKCLYENADVDMLNLHEDIYKKHNINLPHKEFERIWEIMKASGLINPVIGFGNSGKVSLSRAGYQLMAQYGSYENYIKSLNDPKQPQTIILPIQVPGQIISPDEEVIEVDGKSKDKDGKEA